MYLLLEGVNFRAFLPVLAHRFCWVFSVAFAVVWFCNVEVLVTFSFFTFCLFLTFFNVEMLLHAYPNTDPSRFLFEMINGVLLNLYIRLFFGSNLYRFEIDDVNFNPCVSCC